MSLTPADALQAVAEATMTLSSRQVTVITVKDAENGPDLRMSLAQYVIWSVAGVLEERYIGYGDTETKDALRVQLKESLGEFEEEVDEGFHAAGVILGRLGGRRTRRANNRK
jgi:hypothetical protein